VWRNKNYQKKKNENASSAALHKLSSTPTAASTSVQHRSQMAGFQPTESSSSASAKKKKGKRFLEQKVSLFHHFSPRSQ
jgi:hypothetical protein